MFFNSPEFLVFFIVVFTVYWLTPFREARAVLLLLASYYFYACFNGKLAVVVAVSSLVDYVIGVAIENSEAAARRKALLAGSIVMNLGLLFYFKYANFFLDSLHQLLAGMGIHRAMPALDIFLPIGISFYTFEAISYTVDVYTRRARAERNVVHFLLFISFFPRMVAGPIIRARNFLPQLKSRKKFSWPRIELGLQYVLLGLFKKIAIADRMAYLVDPVFDKPGDYSNAGVWVAVIAYSLQIYCDFSGYSDIAIGLAHILGIKLPQNFNMPYLARNIADFWRRWHISLSTWLRDYVFIQLGGSRGTLLKTIFTLLMTFALCGLWHGAKWTFVAWGVIQGCLSVIHRLVAGYCKDRPALKAWMESTPGVVLRVASTYFAVLCSWVVFRAPDFSVAGRIFHGMFFTHSGIMVRVPVGPLSLAGSVAMVVAAHAAAGTGLWKKFMPRLQPAAAGLAYASFVALICLLMTAKQTAFIYFRF